MRKRESYSAENFRSLNWGPITLNLHPVVLAAWATGSQRAGWGETWAGLVTAGAGFCVPLLAFHGLHYQNIFLFFQNGQRVGTWKWFPGSPGSGLPEIGGAETPAEHSTWGWQEGRLHKLAASLCFSPVWRRYHVGCLLRKDPEALKDRKC